MTSQICEPSTTGFDLFLKLYVYGFFLGIMEMKRHFPLALKVLLVVAWSSLHNRDNNLQEAGMAK